MNNFDIKEWFNYLGNIFGFIALLLSLYNWKKSLTKLRTDLKWVPLEEGHWSLEGTISNDSSRPVSILKTELRDRHKAAVKLVEPRKIKTGQYLYMVDGHSVGISYSVAEYPIQLGAYASCNIELVVLGRLDHKKNRLVIFTPGKKFKLKVPQVLSSED